MANQLVLRRPRNAREEQSLRLYLERLREIEEDEENERRQEEEKLRRLEEKIQRERESRHRRNEMLLRGLRLASGGIKSVARNVGSGIRYSANCVGRWCQRPPPNYEDEPMGPPEYLEPDIPAYDDEPLRPPPYREDAEYVFRYGRKSRKPPKKSSKRKSRKPPNRKSPKKGSRRKSR